MKLGITMEGGANRAIFSCGVMDALLDGEIMPDYFIGVSAGMAYGTSYISKQKGRNLKIARETKELTQTQLAKELNKFQSDYSEYETGKVQLDYEKIIYLCKRLDITPNDLFGFP